MLKNKKLAVIGVGKLGEALISGLLKKDAISASDICGTVGHEESLKRIKERLNIEATLDNQKAVKDRDLVLLAVKPQNMDSVLKEIAPVVTKNHLIISVAASVTTGFVEERLPQGVPVVRAMPNTPSVMNVGMAGMCTGTSATDEHKKMAEAIFKCVGETVFVDESLMDGVTALSASGPAYLYVVIESLAEAGVKLGIPRDVSTLLAAQTMLGSAKMILDSKAHPALLKDMVTTPAGCTIDGLMELEEGKLRVTLIKAVVKAAERARELVNTQNTKSKL
ncbi:MAG TPA: pyrroline-5-carboxylate reductase [Candidatus Melainabacteria bacterium]|jgi:pyrroline-5-carboxylate reductase|nr:pyrroline-5-carboxylate reductase [Candidatus Melainabacteria bacterium]HIN66499.1 pyrroline-5-carboxylate reductase [Candidatus Obscuribacterales bacterium]